MIDCRMIRGLVVLALMLGLAACQTRYDPQAEREAMMHESDMEGQEHSGDDDRGHREMRGHDQDGDAGQGGAEGHGRNEHGHRGTTFDAQLASEANYGKDRSVAPPYGHEVQHKANNFHQGHFATYKGRGEFLSDDYPQGTHRVN